MSRETLVFKGKKPSFSALSRQRLRVRFPSGLPICLIWFFAFLLALAAFAWTKENCFENWLATLSAGATFAEKFPLVVKCISESNESADFKFEELVAIRNKLFPTNGKPVRVNQQGKPTCTAISLENSYRTAPDQGVVWTGVSDHFQKSMG